MFFPELDAAGRARAGDVVLEHPRYVHPLTSLPASGVYVAATEEVVVVVEVFVEEWDVVDSVEL